MRIVIGCDHTGVALKVALQETALAEHSVIDVGTDSTDSVDYPDIARAAVAILRKGDADRAILICGTGVGMAIAAGRHRGIRAATCSDPFVAEMSRRHNDANVLCLGARVVGYGMAESIVRTWLHADFDGGRHARRVEKIEGTA
ncbi:MAG: ribose 5-phosphate isomerase B [Candidatus Bipolaricaulota bacterium]|nr:ribose 5-phosphate isomerase B [Candidatus Bipolaricaulota bacterium]